MKVWLTTALLVAVVLVGCGNAAKDVVEGTDELVPRCVTRREDRSLPRSQILTFPTFGQQWVLESSSEKVQITVLEETEVVAGVTTRVVEEPEWVGGELVEVSRNYVVQAPDGSVCYFGEAVDDYKGGELSGHGGAWRAGETGALPGI